MATWYVDFDTGDNSNAGSEAYPWKECPGTQDPTDAVTDGWETIAAGDTVIFTSGQTWTRPISIDSDNFEQPTSEGERITLTSSTESLLDRPIFDLTGYTSYDWGINIRRDYITVQYIELKNLTHSGETYGVYGYSVDYCKLLYSYIHDIFDSSGQVSVCAGADYSTYFEIAYCELKNSEIKLSTYSNGDHNTVHHCLLHQDVGFGGTGLDHGVVFTQDYGEFYNNILWTDQLPSDGPSYAFKIDGDNSGNHSSYNKVYNNLVLDWPAGMAILDSVTGGNTIYSNTIYLQGASGQSTTYYDLHGIALRGDGSSYCKNNIVENNIIYYVKAAATNDNYSFQMIVGAASANVSDNTIKNNLFYYNDSDERFRVYDTATKTMAQMETDWNGSNGNIFTDNIIEVPGFAGGTHVVSDLPTGFDASWYPNDTGLELTGSADAKDVGLTLGSPYDVDIVDTARPQSVGYDIGAYEATTTTTTGAPTTTTTTTTTAAPAPSNPRVMVRK